MTTLLSLIQPLLIYLYPVILGRALVLTGFFVSKAIQKVLNRPLTPYRENLWHLPGYFALGSLGFFGLAILIHYLVLPQWGGSFEALFFPISAALILLSTLVNLIFWPKFNRRLVTKAGLSLIGLIILTAISFSLWTHKSPYSLNWDWYQHQTMARHIGDGKFSYFTSEISDTFGFDSYPPLFHTLIALSQYPADLSPQDTAAYWQATGFWHLFTVGLAAFALGFALTGSGIVAWLAGLLSLFTFDSVISMTSYFFLPQTLAAVVFTLLIAKLLLAYRHQTGFAWWELLSGTLFLILIHYLVGGLAALVLTALVLYRFTTLKLPALTSQFPWVELAVTLVIALFIALFQTDLGWVNQGEAATYTYTLTEKLEILERSYGYLFYGLLILGVIYALKSSNPVLKTGLLVLFGLVLATFAPVPYALKMLTLLRFWLVGFAAMGFYGLLLYIKNPALKAGSVIALFIALIIILVVNISFWKSGLLLNGQYTHLLPSDLEAAAAIKVRFEGKSVLLVSDPATQFFIEGLSGVETIGGAYMKHSEREKIIPSLEQRTPAGLINAIDSLEDAVISDFDHHLIAISGRTFTWVNKPGEDRLAFNVNVWLPAGLSLEDLAFIEAIAGQPGVEIVYQSPYIYVLQVK